MHSVLFELDGVPVYTHGFILILALFACLLLVVLNFFSLFDPRIEPGSIRGAVAVTYNLWVFRRTLLPEFHLSLGEVKHGHENMAG